MQFLLLLGLIFFAAFFLLSFFKDLKFHQTENFYNIVPTGVIDPDFIPNSQTLGYYDFGTRQRYQIVDRGSVDRDGVDLNCNAVEISSILQWIRWNDPDVLNKYVLRFDPSADINNPNDAPRILKELLRNLPSQHKYVPLLRTCSPVAVRV